MALSIDEMTAEIAEPEPRGEPSPVAAPQAKQAVLLRRQREQFARLQQRAARVGAD